jgi:hypothetical protein
LIKGDLGSPFLNLLIFIFEIDVNMKLCPKCNQLKPLTEYSKNKNKNDGLSYCCKTCHHSYITIPHHIKYKEYNKIYGKEWRKNNPNYNKIQNKEYAKKYYSKHKDELKEYNKNYSKTRREQDPLFKLKSNIRNTIIRYIKNPKNNNTEQILGCTFEQLKQHIESQWVEGMNWDNWTQDGWHVDHIIPLASATTEDEIYKLNHYTNLQPLWAPDNMKKGFKF